MKIGDKLRRVLSENPEIQQRRAQLRAIYFISKYDKTLRGEWNRNLIGETCLTVWTINKEGYHTDFNHIWYKPLSAYKLKEEPK
jgi:hypothetical protein